MKYEPLDTLRGIRLDPAFRLDFPLFTASNARRWPFSHMHWALEKLFSQTRWARLAWFFFAWEMAGNCPAQSLVPAPSSNAAASFEDSFRNAILVLGVGGGVTMGLLLVALVLSKRQARRRQMAEAQQKQLAEEIHSALEKQVQELKAELEQRSQALAQETERRMAAETLLRQNAERLSGLEQRVAERTASLAQAEAIIESSDDAIIGATSAGVITSWNTAATRLLGYTAAEIMGKSLTLLIPPDRVEEELQLLTRIERGQRLANLEAGRVRKDGRLIDMAITISPIKDAAGKVVGVSKIARDITDRKKAAERITASLREKDALLREIHHRVKNNMQVVSSLLQLQANYVQDPRALEAFEDCQERIRTMALIHEKLYRTEGLAQIDFKDYLESLSEMLLRAQSRGVKIRSELQIEPIALGIDTAIPLGLIANELISNSLKHAFAGRSEGIVRISLRRLPQNEIQLSIGDDGGGLAGNFAQSQSLGLRLVKILTGQIKGRMEYKNENGVNFSIMFKELATQTV